MNKGLLSYFKFYSDISITAYSHLWDLQISDKYIRTLVNLSDWSIIAWKSTLIWLLLLANYSNNN